MKVCIRSKVGKTGRRHWQVLSGGVVVVSAHSFEKAVEMLPDAVLNARRERERADVIYDSLEPTGRHSMHYRREILEHYGHEAMHRIATAIARKQDENLRCLFGGAVAST